MSYNYVQTFFVDSNAVNGASQVLLSSVELFVKQKPNRENNRSGFSNPSISVQICPADRNKPNVRSMSSAQRTRMSWDQITASSDASVPTLFTFDPPIPLITNNYYGILIQASDDDFVLWDVVQGHRLVDTNTPTSGPHGRYDGYLFEGTSDSSFRAISNKDLKFSVSVARFSANTSVIADLIPENYEFVGVNNINGQFLTRERVFQDAGSPELTVPVIANLAGSLSINALSTRVTGIGTDFVSNVSNGSLIVLSSESDANTFAIGTVSQVINSTAMILESTVPITSNGFNGAYRISPIATVFDSAPYYGRTNEMVLFRSTANSTLKFVGGGLRGVTVSNTGAGYSNTNIVRVVNPGSGGDAVFRINTTNAGSVSSLTVLSSGAGFVPPVSNVRIEVSTVDATLKSGNPGANAVITVTANQVGLSLRGQSSGASANIAAINNVQFAEMWPTLQELNTPDGNVTVRHAFSNGATLGVSNGLFRDTRLGIINRLKDYPATIASRSNEATANSGTSAKLTVSLSVNQANTFLFETPFIDVNRSTVQTYENDINNDVTDEHTNSGNAINKYISRRIGFNRETSSEDLIVYLSANRPVGTDVKVYGKFHNSDDDEPFDDKLWTELIRTTPDVYTPADNEAATTKMEFTIPQYPSVESTLAGVITTANNSAVITGVGTSFSNTLIGKLIRIHSPLFPSNYQVVSVSAVTNATSLTAGSPIVNNSVQESVVGTGLKADLLKYTGTVYNNVLNDNVARYHTISNQAEMDGFDTFAVKVILLSDNKYIVPSVDDIQMIGVSA